MKKLLAAVLALSLLLLSCAGPGSDESSPVRPDDIPAYVPDVAGEHTYAVFEGPDAQAYIAGVAAGVLNGILTPDMSDYRKVKAIADYLIETGYYSLPVGLDVWRIRAVAGERRLSFTENRALSMLLYGIGACEDYASAFILLCRAAGIEASYLPGLTYASGGGLTHHAWNQVKIDGVWYHVDVELEDGVSEGTVHYRYFLKGDATMRSSHFWGQELIDMERLEESQHMAIAGRYMGEASPQDYPTPEPKAIPVTPAPDEEAILEELRQEFAAFEAAYGPLDYMELNILPPVFGETGGYWSYWTAPEGMEDWIYQLVVNKLVLTPRQGSMRLFGARRAAASRAVDGDLRVTGLSLEADRVKMRRH